LAIASFLVPIDVVAELKNLPIISVVGSVITDDSVASDATKVCNISEHGVAVTQGVTDDVIHDNVDFVSCLTKSMWMR